MTEFEKKVAALRQHHEELLSQKNEPVEWGNGIYEKYKNPILTAAHVPLEWKYDFNEQDNPYLMQSPNGIDNFRFWDEPITMPDDVIPATNIYDMRITQHEDGWIYGVFCAERHDDSQPGNLSAATATAAIARTKDLKTWYRLPDLKTKSQQRNVVLHRTVSSTPVQAVVSVGHSSMTLQMRRSRKRLLSMSASTTPSPR